MNIIYQKQNNKKHIPFNILFIKTPFDKFVNLITYTRVQSLCTYVQYYLLHIYNVVPHQARHLFILNINYF